MQVVHPPLRDPGPSWKEEGGPPWAAAASPQTLVTPRSLPGLWKRVIVLRLGQNSVETPGPHPLPVRGPRIPHGGTLDLLLVAEEG